MGPTGATGCTGITGPKGDPGDPGPPGYILGNVNHDIIVMANIGIQTTTPSFPLDVSGIINCKGMLINGSSVNNTPVYKYKEFTPVQNSNIIIIKSYEDGRYIWQLEGISGYYQFNFSGLYTFINDSTTDSINYPNVINFILDDTSVIFNYPIFNSGIINNLKDITTGDDLSFSLTCANSKFSTTGTTSLTVPPQSLISLKPDFKNNVWNVDISFPITIPIPTPITNMYNGAFLKLLGNNYYEPCDITLFEATELVNSAEDIYPFITIWNCINDFNNTSTITINLNCTTSLFVGNAGTNLKTIRILPNQQISLISDGTNWIVNNNSINANNITSGTLPISVSTETYTPANCAFSDITSELNITITRTGKTVSIHQTGRIYLQYSGNNPAYKINTNLPSRFCPTANNNLTNGFFIPITVYETSIYGGYFFINNDGTIYGILNNTMLSGDFVNSAENCPDGGLEGKTFEVYMGSFSYYTENP